MGLGNEFLDTTSKAQATPAKTKWDYIPTIITARETKSKMRRQFTEWEKVFVNHLPGKGLIPKIYKDLI